MYHQRAGRGVQWMEDYWVGDIKGNGFLKNMINRIFHPWYLATAIRYQGWSYTKGGRVDLAQLFSKPGLCRPQTGLGPRRRLSDTESAWQGRTDAGSIPGWGRSLGGGNDQPLQYSCLENPMDRGAWWATVVGSQKVRHNWYTEYALTETLSRKDLRGTWLKFAQGESCCCFFFNQMQLIKMRSYRVRMGLNSTGTEDLKRPQRHKHPGKNLWLWMQKLEWLIYKPKNSQGLLTTMRQDEKAGKFLP